MPRTNRDGKDIKLVVGWLTGRSVSDAEMAEAIGIPTTTYSRNKDADEFPSFEELNSIARHFDLNALMLQVAFGYLDINTVILDEEGMRQYVEQGGGDVPSLPTRQVRRHRREGAPPGP